MAVQLTHDIGNTGLSADHWALVRAVLHREGTTNSFTLSGIYRLWASAAAYAAGQQPVQNIRQAVNTGVLSGNPTAGQMQSALDAAAVAAGGSLEGGSVV